MEDLDAFEDLVEPAILAEMNGEFILHRTVQVAAAGRQQFVLLAVTAVEPHQLRRDRLVRALDAVEREEFAQIIAYL